MVNMKNQHILFVHKILFKWKYVVLKCYKCIYIYISIYIQHNKLKNNYYLKFLKTVVIYYYEFVNYGIICVIYITSLPYIYI